MLGGPERGADGAGGRELAGRGSSQPGWLWALGLGVSESFTGKSPFPARLVDGVTSGHPIHPIHPQTSASSSVKWEPSSQEKPHAWETRHGGKELSL